MKLCKANGIKENTSWALTRYREVEKQKIMIRQRQETRYKKVTLFDYLVHYSYNRDKKEVIDVATV
jgi:hypothetical protein